MTAIAESRVDPSTFYEEIEDAILEAEELTDSLLGPDDTFKSDTWGRGSPHEGTGVWNSEFGQGVLVYMEEIHIKNPFRGMSIGTKLFNQALDWVDKEARELGKDQDFGSYLVVAPGALRQDLVTDFGHGNLYGGYGRRQAEVNAFKKKLDDKAIAFWRKQGFRRVGLSGFWAYATNPNHPNTQLTAEEDAKRDDIDPPEPDDMDLPAYLTA